jgi:predicted amidohydrolase YtcJ
VTRQPGVLLRNVELLDGRLTDVRVAHGTVTQLGALRRLPGEALVDGAGGALSVGLADHHLHLLAMAAAAESLDLSPAAAPGPGAVAAALASATADSTGWIRAVGYAGQAGPLDLEYLDRLRPATRVRIQHRSGALWLLNSAALAATGIGEAPGGRLWRADSRLAERLPRAPAPDLGRLGRELAGYGITAVTDATADLPPRSQALIADAVLAGRLPQRVLLLGAGSREGLPQRISIGPAKIVIADHALPTFDLLRDRVRAARDRRRAVAVHCVTREALALTIAVLDDVGPHPRDRIEHASLVDAAAITQLRRLGLTVVTQPGFIADRGDDYRRDLAPDDVADLYRLESLRAGGVPVACSSDAPFGPADPWTVLRAASERRTPGGTVLGNAERMTVVRALRGYLAAPLRPGGPARRVTVGAPADLALMHAPWSAVLAAPQRGLVRCTFYGGRIHE